MKQQIQYCTASDGVRLAYAITGAGSPVIRTSHWLTHLEHDLTSPVWKHVVLAFDTHHRFVRYDARGEGMSQRAVDEIDFDAWLRDLDAVVAATGFERFALFGCSQGAATAIAYAARHPERVSHLILYGGFARGIAHWGETEEEGRRNVDLAMALVRQGWGTRSVAHRQWFTSTFLPGGSAEQYRWFNRMQQVSAAPDMAARHLQATAALDVTALLPKVRVPTLVLHCRDDHVAPFELGEDLAAGIPGARLVPLEGDNHLFLAGSTAHEAFVEAVYAFLGDPPPHGPLPGTMGWGERLGHAVRSTEQHSLVKILLLISAIVGLALSVGQVTHWF